MLGYRAEIMIQPLVAVQLNTLLSTPIVVALHVPDTWKGKDPFKAEAKLSIPGSPSVLEELAWSKTEAKGVVLEDDGGRGPVYFVFDNIFPSFITETARSFLKLTITFNVSYVELQGVVAECLLNCKPEPSVAFELGGMSKQSVQLRDS